MPWAKRATKSIPSTGSQKATIEVNDYSLGMNSFVSNDKFPLKNGGSNMWRLAQDARIITLGDYETRKGFDFHSAAAGETLDQSQTSVTGASDKSFNTVTRLAQKWTAGTSGRLSKYEARLKNDIPATGTIIIEHWTDSSGSPGVLVARSSIASSTVTTSYAYIAARFPDAPTIVSGTSYWCISYVQSVGTNNYKWSGTTSATNAKTSVDSGTSWSSTSYALNFKQYYATSGAPKGMFRAYKSDGTKVTLFVQGTTLYSVDDTTGALTAIKTGLSASATNYRFIIVNDIIYYVNGYDGYRKWNFTIESQVNATNYSNIVLHKGVVFLNQVADPNQWDYSNFADYETFTSTDFIEVPAPKTGDPSTAALSLNGYLLIWTRNNKFILSGDDNATFQLDEAPDQHGTYSQETVTKDDNFAYYLSADGVRYTNGSEPHLMSDNNYKDIFSMSNKSSCCLVINKGRLYLWYRSIGSNVNDTCYVWNTNFSSGDRDCVESKDTNAYVSFAIAAYEDNDDLLVASSLIGQVYWQEKDSNDCTNLGGDINFMLQTHYMTFSSPAVLKEIRNWLPRFGAQSGNYTISTEYASDLRDNWQVHSTLSVQGSGYIWGSSATVWGAFTWGTTAEVQGALYVPGEYRRVALRYKHYGTRQPNSFLGHSMVVQTRRLR